MSTDNGSHRMGRRCLRNKYSRPGIYHITIPVNEAWHEPLSRIVGSLDKGDGDADAPHVVLSLVGQMVEQELTTSITAHYPFIEVQDYVIMPDHLHFIIVVHQSIISANGRETHLGQVIAGFKKGCNRRFWEIIGLQGEPAFATASAPSSMISHSSQQIAVHPQFKSLSSPSPGSTLPAKRTPSWGTTNRPPLFAYGYVDVMPLSHEQLETQRRYIHNNPRSRLLRSSNRPWLQTQRNSMPTALSINALKGYLQRECTIKQFTEDFWLNITSKLKTTDGMIVCDSYGNRQLLERRLLPVVCHRKDAALFPQQMQRCLEEAAQGAVLVSARIAKGEQAIIDATLAHSYPVIILKDNGFPDRYHPSDRLTEQCSSGNLLLLTPWHYHYRTADSHISVVECKTMNCIVQALCRLKDNWWKFVLS